VISVRKDYINIIIYNMQKFLDLDLLSVTVDLKKLLTWEDLIEVQRWSVYVNIKSDRTRKLKKNI
jgi:hypothetical protein